MLGGRSGNNTHLQSLIFKKHNAAPVPNCVFGEGISSYFAESRFSLCIPRLLFLAAVAEARFEDGAYATWIGGTRFGDFGLMSGSLAVRACCHWQLINLPWLLHARLVPAAKIGGCTVQL